jgi:hypothetical protein
MCPVLVLPWLLVLPRTTLANLVVYYVDQADVQGLAALLVAELL